MPDRDILHFLQTEHSHASLGLSLSGTGPQAPSDERANLLRSLYEQRLRNVVGQLKDTMAHMRGDAATQALLADSSTSEFAAVSFACVASLTVWLSTQKK